LTAISIAMIPVVARGQTPPVHAPLPFAAYDRDGDGFISEAEFTAVTQATSNRSDAAGVLDFLALDRDGDRRVSASEYRAALQARTDRRRALRLRPAPESDEDMESEMGK